MGRQRAHQDRDHPVSSITGFPGSSSSDQSTKDDQWSSHTSRPILGLAQSATTAIKTRTLRHRQSCDSARRSQNFAARDPKAEPTGYPGDRRRPTSPIPLPGAQGGTAGCHPSLPGGSSVGFGYLGQVSTLTRSAPSGCRLIYCVGTVSLTGGEQERALRRMRITPPRLHPAIGLRPQREISAALIAR